ncbi:MAG: hypothetical protein ACO1NY_02105 [Pseudorhodoplanes sp.]
MAQFKEAWLAHQRKRWMRPDAYRWVRPDYARLLSPSERKAGFDPDQPRDELGQWTETGAEEDIESIEEFIGDDSLLDEFSAASIRGHHWVPWAVFKNLDLRPETYSAFANATTGPLAGQRHGNSKEHMQYSEAVDDLIKEFKRREGISDREMTPDHAKRILDQVKASKEPRIRDFNLNIYRREVYYLIQRRGRKPE